METIPVDAHYGAYLYSFGLVADVQGGDKPDYKFKFYRCGFTLYYFIMHLFWHLFASMNAHFRL